VDARQVPIILDEDVERSINSKNDIESIRSIRRCFARALHPYAGSYMAWLANCNISPHEFGMVLGLDSWFKADYVSSSFGVALSEGLRSRGGKYKIKCEGPPRDYQRASRDRDWISCDEDDIPTLTQDDTNAYEGMRTSLIPWGGLGWIK
jgi:hypothetical protein